MAKKVTGEGKVEIKNGRPVLKMRGLESLVHELSYVFKIQDVEELTIQFTRRGKKMKTNPQLGYLFGHLGFVGMQVLQEAGWTQITTSYQAVKFIADQLGFHEEFINEETGEVITQLKSIADSEVEEISTLIQNMIVFLLEQGANIMLPDEYKKSKKL